MNDTQQYFLNSSSQSDTFRINKQLLFDIPLLIHKGLIQSYSHGYFVLAYSCIIDHLWNNYKYADKEFAYNAKNILKLLSLSSSLKTCFYLTKKGGLLDELDYITYVRDFPVQDVNGVDLMYSGYSTDETFPIFSSSRNLIPKPIVKSNEYIEFTLDEFSIIFFNDTSLDSRQLFYFYSMIKANSYNATVQLIEGYTTAMNSKKTTAINYLSFLKDNFEINIERELMS